MGSAKIQEEIRNLSSHELVQLSQDIASEMSNRSRSAEMSASRSARRLDEAEASGARRHGLDEVSASKCFSKAPASRQKLHLDALAYAEQNKCSYVEAINAVSAAA